jgi:hypothetical protein
MSDCTELRLRERADGLAGEGHEGMRKVGTA